MWPLQAATQQVGVQPVQVESPQTIELHAAQESGKVGSGSTACECHEVQRVHRGYRQGVKDNYS